MAPFFLTFSSLLWNGRLPTFLALSSLHGGVERTFLTHLNGKTHLHCHK